MRNKLSCNPASRRNDRSRRPSARRAACLAAATRVVLGWRTAFAVTAPPWMHAQVGAAEPAHDDKTEAVLLYSESTVAVQPSGLIKRLDRKVYKILRPSGESYGTLRVDFDSQTRVTDIHGWCIPAEGKDYEVKAREAIESALPGVDGGELVSDVRTKLLTVPAAVPGSLVGFEVQQEEHPYVMADEWEFQDTIPVREAHYTLVLPPAWSYKATWLNHAAETPATPAAGQWRWTVTDVAPIKIERDMPPWRGIAAKLVLSLEPANGQARGFQSWQELGTWYTALTLGRRDPSPAIQQKVGELTAQAPTLPAKVQALAAFVQRDIRYVAIELGIGGMQPHPAIDVFSNRFGDCKDKVTLLSSMLKQIGVDSHYVIINTSRGSITASTPPNLGFNHVILAVQLPAAWDAPPELAEIKHAKLGRLVFFDPTDPLTPFGRLSGSLQANYGLLVTPDGGELLALPQLPASSNSVERSAKLTLDASGTLRGDVHEVWSGDMAAIQRYSPRSASQDTDRIRPIEAVLSHSLTKFQIMNASVHNLPAIQMPLEWTYTLEAEQYAKVNGMLMLVRPRVIGSKSSAILETREARKYPIEFDGPARDADTFEIALPVGYQVEELPPPVKVDYGFASYQSSTQLVGRSLRYTRTLEIKDLSVPVAKANELREFYRIIDNDERMSAVLTHTTP